MPSTTPERMTPQEAVKRLRKDCDERELQGIAQGTLPVLTVEEVRWVVDHVVFPPSEGLLITEVEARLLLALVEGRPVRWDDITTLTGRLAVIGGVHA